MKRVQWNVSAGAVLLFALMYFFDGSGVLSASLPAVLAHELGHLIPLRLCRCPLRRVSIGVFGVEIDYAGQLRGRRAIACIGGGPLAGLLYVLLACSLGGTFWRMSGAVSFLLTAFNLLPVLPLDGGRLAAAVTDDAFGAKLSRWASLLLVLAGAGIALRFHAVSLLLTGAWLAVCNYRA